MRLLFVWIVAFGICYTPSLAADKVVVIPLYKKVEQECPACPVCPGTNVGDTAFHGYITNGSIIYIGNIYQTDIGKLVQIVGMSIGGIINTHWDYFYVAPEVLPDPNHGRKGQFYRIYEGKVVFADYL